MRRCIAIFLAVCCVISCMYSATAIVVHAANQSGTVCVSDNLRVRSGPGTNYSHIGNLYNGDKVTILASATDSSGAVWYQITASSIKGYVHSKYISIDEALPEYTPDADFEKYLTQQGFPESYKPYLRNLHAQYPNWLFIADKISPTWAETLAGESVLGRNLVHTSRPNSWKSMEPGAYNWETNKWVGLDGSSWVAASAGIIAYHLDPRNFLNSTDIFQFLNHSYNSKYQTLAGLKKMVSGTFLSKNFPEDPDGKGTYSTYSDVLIEAASQSKVNPYVLASMILVEQGTNGTGKSISGTVNGYEGYYNYLNVRAYASGGYDAVQYGLLYAKGSGSYNRPWNTRFKSIIGGAIHYGTNYVNRGQDTLYYKKFNVVNVSDELFKHQYMTNVEGAASEGKTLAKAYANVSDSTLIFSIPVYKDIPDAVCAKPGSNGTTNDYLKSLSVQGYSLTPSFNSTTTEYEIIVPATVSSVKISATPSDSAAKVTGTGTFNISSNGSKAVISVTSTAGSVRKYVITIAKQAAEVAPPTVTTDYTISGSNISGVQPGTSISAFLGGLKIKNGTASVSKNGSNVTTGKIGTGCKVSIKKSNGEIYRSYNIIIYGDLNGNGTVDIVDLAKLKKHLLGVEVLSGNAFTAADVKRGKAANGINIVDLAVMKKHILDISKISQ